MRSRKSIDGAEEDDERGDLPERAGVGDRHVGERNDVAEDSGGLAEVAGEHPRFEHSGSFLP